MLINKIKKCKPLEIDNKLKEYLIKNNDKNSLSDKIKEFFKELQEHRNDMSKMNEVQLSTDEIKNNLDILSKYINKLNILKKKMIFGKEKYSCKLPFDWSDTLKGGHTKSYNVEFEIYNALFNVAVLYYCNGLVLAGNEMPSKEIRKESTNSFKHAIYVFNIIKEEANKKIGEKELPADLDESHLNYCMTMCQIEGQIQIYKIAKETSPKEFPLHAKLLLGVSDLYNEIKEVTKKLKYKRGEVDNMILYFENRAKYYKAGMFRDLKNENKKIFDEKGTGYGEVAFFLSKLVEELTECQKSIHKLGKFLNIESFEKELEEAKQELKEAQDLNNRIYHQASPKEENLNYESKILMKESMPKKFYIEEDKSLLNELDLLAPKEVRDMIDRYRPKMNIFITKCLDQYENEGTIDNFIQKLHLPKKLIKKPVKEGEEEENDVKELPGELWDKINSVQQAGGTMALTNIMQGIMNKSDYLINTLEGLLHSFESEDKDDNQCRQRFRERWTRGPSQQFNYKMVQAAQQFLSSLRSAKEFDQKENNNIVNNINQFEILNLTKEKLNEKIPAEESEIQTEETQEEKEIRNEILKLYDLKEKCANIMRPIFNQINDDSKIIIQFMEVLAKQSTEQIIFERNKDSFQKKFNELKNITEEVKKQESAVNEIIGKNWDKISNNKDKGKNNENKEMEYYAKLYQLSNMFLNELEKVKKGDNYYNDMKNKIDNLMKYSNEWMIKRSNEKNMMLKNLNNF